MPEIKLIKHYLPHALRLAFLFLALCLFSPFDSPLHASQDNPVSLVDASSNNFPPMNILDANGQLNGFGVELADAVAKAAGFQIRHIHSEYWPTVLAWLESGQADFIHDTGYTIQRTAFLDYTDPIIEMPESIFVRSDRWDITDLNSLKGKTVGCVDKHITHLYLNNYPHIQCKIVKTPVQGIYELSAGHVDAFIYPRQIALYMIQNMRLSDKIKITGEPLRTLKWCMVVKKGNQQVLDQLNKGLRQVKASGEYQRIYSKWWGLKILSGYTRQEVIIIATASVVLACLVILALCLFVYSRSLRSRKLSLEMEIAERKKAEAENIRLQHQLTHSQKMESLGTLAGGIAHDFNNILAVIIGYTELALQESEINPASANALEQVFIAVDRAKSLIKRIMTFSRKMDMDGKPLDLNEVIEHAVEMLQRTIPRMIDIELRLSDESCLVNGDSGQLEQVLLNLGSNSSDAMPAGGKLVIATNLVSVDDEYTNLQPGNYVQCAVSDTGHGMDQRTMEHIFDPFFTTKDVGSGTGMGLAVAYGIVKTHGGIITCYSEPGQGAIFKILLPATGEPLAQDVISGPKQKALANGSETILIVDDEPDLREIGQKILTNSGYSILLAATGEEALEIYDDKGGDIDLVILDISMPGMGGNVCLQHLKEKDPTVKIIIASGYAIKGTLEQSLKNGALGYLAKPFNKKELLEAVRRALDA